MVPWGDVERSEWEASAVCVENTMCTILCER
jgi:hypothetical protein